MNSSHAGPRRRRLSQRNFPTPFLAGPVAAKYPVCVHVRMSTSSNVKCESKEQEVEVTRASKGKSPEEAHTGDEEKVGHRDGFNQGVKY